MIEAPIRHSKILAVIVLVIVILGIAVIRLIPVQMIPDLDVRTISVITVWPGATPQDIEKEILIEQERYLRNIPSLIRMESVADTGQAYIELDFPFGININNTLIEVSNALSQVASYPENVDQPRISSSSFSDTPFLYFVLTPLPGNPMNIDLDMVTDFVNDNVRSRMERVPGVAEVQLRGGAERQLQIHVDPASLAQRGLSLMDVRQAIRARNVDISAGDIDESQHRYLLRTVGRFQDIPDVENLILVQRGDAQVRLKDVASITLDHHEVREIAMLGDLRGLVLAVKKQPGSNVINIRKAMLTTIEEMRVDVLAPNGLEIILGSDDVRYVTASIQNVTQNLLLGVLLATVILYLFLRTARGTFIGLIGMPLCIIAAFLGLYFFGRTINVISMAGIAFAITMTIDNTIVVLENIESARRQGLDKITAAVTATRDVWPAVLASSLTTMIVFAPVLLVQEEAGQLYSDIAIVISVAIFASMLFAVFVVPAASIWLGVGNRQSVKAPQTHRRNNWVLTSVRWLTLGTIRPIITIISLLMITVVTAWLIMPDAEYLPDGEEPKAFTTMSAPPGYSLSEMRRIGFEINDILMQARGADPQLFHHGEQLIPSLSYYLLRITPGYVRVMSEPTNHQDLDIMMQRLTELFRSYPGMRAFSGKGSIISSSQGGTRAVSLDISGPNMGDLYQTAEKTIQRARILFENPQIDAIPSSLSLEQPLIEIQPRWSRLSEVGFSATDFGFSVAAISDGAFVDEFFLDDTKIDIFLFSDVGQQQSLSGLAEAPIYTPKGDVLPLNALADLVEKLDSNALRRIDGSRTVTLFIIPPRNIPLETAVQRVRGQMIPDMQQAGDIEKGVTITISGAADQLDATRESLSENMLIAALLVYLLLVAIFAHWGYPLLVMATVPLGMAAGIVGLVMANHLGGLLPLIGLSSVILSFDMLTMLGMVILLGTVINNPILIVAETRQNLLDKTLSLHEAVNRAVAKRFRPIMMTTLTTIFGLAPLIFIPGEGTELYRGMGIVIMVGITMATMVTLTYLPCLLMLALSFKNQRLKEN